MSIQEMKNRLHQLIDSADDEPALERLLDSAKQLLADQTEQDTTDDLTDEQVEGLEKAREEVRNGNFVTLADHKQKIAQWLAARK